MLCCVGNLTKVLQQTINICKTFENLAQTWSCLNSMAFVVIHCSTRCSYLCALHLRTNFSGKSRKKSILLKMWEWVIFFTCTTLGSVRICYFWNAFTCPYTLVSAGTVRNGKGAASLLWTADICCLSFSSGKHWEDWSHSASFVQLSWTLKKHTMCAFSELWA